MLNSHHPFLPSSTRLSPSPPPLHRSPLSPLAAIYTLTCSHITLTHTWVPTQTPTSPAHVLEARAHTCTSRWSAALIPVSDCKTLELILRSRREVRGGLFLKNRKRVRRRNGSRRKAVSFPSCTSPMAASLSRVSVDCHAHVL